MVDNVSGTSTAATADYWWFVYLVYCADEMAGECMLLSGQCRATMVGVSALHCYSLLRAAYWDAIPDSIDVHDRERY